MSPGVPGVPPNSGAMAYGHGSRPGVRPVTFAWVTAPTVATGAPLNWVSVRCGGFGIGSGQPAVDQIW